MKKLIQILFLLSSFILSGCNGNPNHPISGKTYTSESAFTAYVFHSSGSCEIHYYIKKRPDIFDHFQWKVNGSNINIYYDNSFHWKKDVRGLLLETLIYNSSDNTLKDKDGHIYYCDK